MSAALPWILALAVTAGSIRAQGAPVEVSDASCAACHPGAAKGLARSVHAALAHDAATACTVCHQGAAAHLAVALQPEQPAVAPFPVGAASCLACHQGRDLAPALAAHPFAGTGSRPADLPPALELPADGGILGLQWSAMAAAGYRFVSRGGSRARYKTDVNLDDGFRLGAAELEGTGSGDAWADTLRLSAHDIADPYQRLEGLVEKRHLYRGKAGFVKSAVTYRASGDFHRVDRKSETTSVELAFEPADELELFGSFQRTLQDGFWLTNRIGNRNVTPYTTIPGVASPRELDADAADLGLRGTIAGVRWLAAVEHRDDETRDRFGYSRMASVNPAFPESEDFLARSTLRGPGARWALGRDFEGLTLDFAGRVLELERRILGSGTQQGYDISDFRTTTSAFAAGKARTWLLDGSAELEVSDGIALLGDLRWVDHREELDLDQTDVTFYPTLGTTTTTTTDVTQITAQRQLEGSVQADAEVLDGLTLTLGYGFAREWLKVPDLEAGDPDFRRGLIQNDGVLAGVQWRPDQRWTVEAGYKDFGQNGVQLHELAEDRSRGESAKVRYKQDQWQAATFVKHSRRHNDTSRTRAETLAAGLSGGVQPLAALDLHASWVFTDLDSRTLTSFYFDPDPNPYPTWVGFDGSTHTLTAGLGARPESRVQWRFDGAFTETRGSFDVRLWDWTAGIGVRVVEGGEAGVDVRVVDYADGSGQDAYDAVITWVYWRQRLGGG